MVTIIKDKAYRKTLKLKVIISYYFIVTACLLLINLLLFFALEENKLDERKNKLSSYCRTIADVVLESGMGNVPLVETTVKTLSVQSNSRIVVFDRNAVVTNDSSNAMVGQKIINIKDIEKVLKGNETTSKHLAREDKIMHFSIPIIKGNEIYGGVILSNPINDIYEDIFRIIKKLVFISALILTLLGVFSYMIATMITGPIERVIGATESMAEGDLNQRVEVKSNDELGRLCSAFNKMNEKINLMDRERRQFVADASHELKSPLTSIKVLVQSLIGGAIDNKEIALEFLNDIDMEVDRLTDIVSNLLELTKLEGSYGIKVEIFDIDSIFKEIIKKLTPISKIKKVAIRYEGSSILMEGNKENILRAIYNIVENAIKYSNENSFIDIWTERDTCIKIYVKDTGVGIPQDEINKIFERFYRVDKTRARKTGGSGLGLSIAMEIIKRHNGEIDVKSKVGEGSLFIITLPYKYNS